MRDGKLPVTAEFHFRQTKMLPFRSNVTWSNAPVGRTPCIRVRKIDAPNGLMLTRTRPNLPFIHARNDDPAGFSGQNPRRLQKWKFFLFLPCILATAIFQATDSAVRDFHFKAIWPNIIKSIEYFLHFRFVSRIILAVFRDFQNPSGI